MLCPEALVYSTMGRESAWVSHNTISIHHIEQQPKSSNLEGLGGKVFNVEMNKCVGTLANMNVLCGRPVGSPLVAHIGQCSHTM